MREYLSALGALVAGSVGVVLAYSMIWATATVAVFSGAQSSPTAQVELTGRDLVPLGSAGGWLALAGVAGIVATSTWGRRLVGIVVMIAGGCAGVAALTFGLTRSAFVDAALAARTSGAATASEVAASAWWIPAALAGLLTVVVGLLAAVRGPRWPGLSRRYARGSDGRALAVDAGAPVGGIAAWDALDRGEDPTDQAGAPPTGSMAPDDVGAQGHGDREDP